MEFEQGTQSIIRLKSTTFVLHCNNVLLTDLYKRVLKEKFHKNGKQSTIPFYVLLVLSVYACRILWITFLFVGQL